MIQMQIGLLVSEVATEVSQGIESNIYSETILEISEIDTYKYCAKGTYIESKIYVKLMIGDMYKSHTKAQNESQMTKRMSAMLISFILLEKYLEVLAKRKTSEAISKLMDLAPDTATLLIHDNDRNVVAKRTISSQLIQRNDIIKILPGEKVPSDD